jgi:hypothetical protein
MALRPRDPRIGLSRAGNPCSWCEQALGIEPERGASHGICERHYRELLARVKHRRELARRSHPTPPQGEPV